MKKSLLKVKNTITFEDKLNAIDLILNAFWDDETGEYTPWMEEPARVIAVGKYFIEGYTLEDFKVGLKVPSKLMPKRIRGGVLLVNTTYEMRWEQCHKMK